MELDLSPKLAKKVYGDNGGAYYAWSPSELPMLREGNIGAGKLALEKHGFALPRYSDSAKVAYVLQGIYICSFSDLFLFFSHRYVLWVLILTYYSSLIFLFYRKWYSGDCPS
jgi:hypothetical protein